MKRTDRQIDIYDLPSVRSFVVQMRSLDTSVSVVTRLRPRRPGLSSGQGFLPSPGHL